MTELSSNLGYFDESVPGDMRLWDEFEEEGEIADEDY